MNGARFFLDTNIFVYSLGEHDRAKARRADELVQLGLSSGLGQVSIQIAQEFCNVILRRVPRPMRPADIEIYLETVFAPMLAVVTTIELLQAGLRLQERYRLAWYDALIVAAAQQSRCSILYSEDLQHGQEFGLVRVENPFH